MIEKAKTLDLKSLMSVKLVSMSELYSVKYPVTAV